MRARFIVLAIAAGLTLCDTAPACGPFFPYAYFAFGREHDVLKLPDMPFLVEVNRELGSPADPYYPQTSPEKSQARSRDADIEALAIALEVGGTASDAAAKIVDNYRAAREHGTPLDAAALPREFVLYAEGAALYRAERPDDAIAKWRELLALPAEDRRNKSVWAAYMMGRALRDSAPEQAVAAFDQARALAGEGFADPIDLAAESVGWQAYIDYTAQDYVSAIERYIRQIKVARSGAGTAYRSIDMACAHIVESPDLMAACTSNPTVRPIVAAWIVSHPVRGAVVRPWLFSLVENVPLADIAQADLLAWAAYSNGDFDTARKFIEAPSAATPSGKRVRYKLLLRDGNIDEAMKLMEELAREIPESSAVPAYVEENSYPPSTESELGVLRLGKQQYVEAFESFLRAGIWFDAAYVGERVLTTSELKDYVDTHAADPVLAVPYDGDYYYMDVWNDAAQSPRYIPTLGDATRYLLGRRLVRDGRWSEAVPYLPLKPAETANQWAALRDAGRAGAPPEMEQSSWEWFVGKTPRTVVDRDRAAKLKAAATFTREHGMELMGTEVQPDWHVFGGMFEIPGFYGARARWEGPEVPKYESGYEAKPEKLPEDLARVLSASEDELQRVRESAPTPDKRFHYRYTAADLMWQAAQLLPNDDVETMRVLYTGGQYLAKRDPVAANRFYRALVWRNPNMPYAQQADKIRWFPQKPPE